MKKTHRDILLLGALCLLSIIGYLFLSIQTTGIGFPLDDAWIHQTFARNFAQDKIWAFQEGQPSGGSTGPAYGMILSLVYHAGVPVVWGTHFIGFVLLWGTAVGGYLVGKMLLPESKYASILSGILICLEWHLVWSSLSGMETLLLGLIGVYVLLWLVEERENYWVPGLLIGLSIWIRPDGITLAGPVFLVAVLGPGKWKQKLTILIQFLSVLIVIAALYFRFNQVVAGDIWPNTFFAKQAEYAILQETKYFIRYGRLGLQIITGVGVVLLPGVLYQIISAIKTRNWGEVGFFTWLIGYLGIYACRLPVVYQHGRYVMPVIPVFILLGVIGYFRLFQTTSDNLWVGILRKTIWVSGGVVQIIFWVLGARAYALDVGVIESAMVGTAKWISQNTEKDAVIGAHDIGALGYYGGREIIDLAGLVSPDVISFIRNEEKLADYLDEKNVDYLMTFPGWYPDLIEGLQPVYMSEARFTDLFGAERMTVYIWE